MILYDFKCESGHRFESFATYEQKKTTCPTCNALATKQVSCPKVIDVPGMGGKVITGIKQVNRTKRFSK